MQVLSPAMQYSEEAQARSQPLRIAGDGEQGLGGDAEQDLVNRLFVVEGYLGDGFGKGKDHVEVFGGQQFGLPLLEPLSACQSLALGTVAVPARAVAGVRVLAVVAPFDHTAQRRSPAGLDGLHQAALMQG